jgi:hypothetical protein
MSFVNSLSSEDPTSSRSRDNEARTVASQGVVETYVQFFYAIHINAAIP